MISDLLVYALVKRKNEEVYNLTEENLMILQKDEFDNDAELTEKDKNFIRAHPKKNEKELVNILKNKGVVFNFVSEDDAAKRLRENTYYFKVSAFRKNFRKDQNGKYVGLDFANLNDLGILDMRFRTILLKASLDLEHALKTSILANITRDVNEDGYTIVRDFFETSFLNKDEILSKASKKGNYLFPVYKKHSETLSVWVLFELLSFGQFGEFLEFYYKRVTLNKSQYAIPAKLFRYAKNVRNAAAHNNPLILNLTKGSVVSVPDEIAKLRRKIGLKNNISNKQRTIDILSLFHLHSIFCSVGIKNNFLEELTIFINRCLRDKKFYEKNSLPEEYLIALSKVLAHYKRK